MEIQTGEWIEFDFGGNSVKHMNFDSEGYQFGKYFEYYYDGKIKWKGQYSLISIDYLSYGEKKVKHKTSTKSGVWYHYDEFGQLLEKVKYKWKQ